MLCQDFQHFFDDTFVVRRQWVEAFCDAIVAKGVKVRWKCLARVDLVDRGLLERMKAAQASFSPWTGKGSARRPLFQNYDWVDWAEPARVQRLLGAKLDYVSHKALVWRPHYFGSLLSVSPNSWHLALSVAQELRGHANAELASIEYTLAKYIGLRWHHKQFCFISDPPSVVHTNKSGLPHCTTGPALAWEDGLELYFVNGRKVDAETFQPINRP